MHEPKLAPISKNVNKKYRHILPSYQLKISSIIFTLLLGFLAQAQNNDALFEDATKAYNEGTYETAIDLYETIIENGQHSAPLYYNLANAYYKQNDVAHSIYYYEKALLLAPNDPEIQNNLGYAQQMTLDAIDPLPQTSLSKFYLSITNKLTFDQWSYTAIASMLLFVLLYILFYYAAYASRKRWAFIGSLASLGLCVLAVVFAYLRYTDYKADQPAIIFADEVSITSEPNTASSEAFVLHAGTKVTVLETLNDWKKIAIANGKTGWLLQTNLKELKDF